MFLWLTFLTGIAYPLLITGIAQLTMKQKADGHFIVTKDKKIVGATLIGQKFASDKYFWGRPSAVDNNPLPSGASNWGPINPALKKAVEERKANIKKKQGANEENIPSELLFASGSGLDPHISPGTTKFQIERIIKVRGWDEKKAKESIHKLIEHLTEDRTFGFLGEPRLNVLKLNLALDDLGEKLKSPQAKH